MLQLKALGRLGAIILAIIALGPSVVWAQEPAPVELTEDLLSGVEVSGYWRHAEEAGSEWRLTLRDPSGELLSLDSVDVEYLAGGPDRPGPEGSAPAPRRSLVLDISRPRSIEGPDTVLMRAADTALARNLGLESVLQRLGLQDAVLLSASPDLENLDFAVGVQGMLPSWLDFGSRQWAHFLTASAQVERISQQDQEPEVTGLGSVHAYWGRGWGWESRHQAASVLNDVRRAIGEAERRTGGPPAAAPQAIDAVLAAARSVPAWRESAELCETLERPLGPGDGSYRDLSADLPALQVFLEALAGELAAYPDLSASREEALGWADHPELFLGGRLAPALRAQLIADNALDLMPPLTRKEALREAELRGISSEELATAWVTLETVVDALDPRVLAVYHGVVTAAEPAGELPEEIRDVVGTAFHTVRWAPPQEWYAHVLSYVGEHARVWRPRVTFSLDAAGWWNWDSELDPAALLEARLTWRPNPFTPYGLTLSHKRGKEESDRERRIDWTSLEFSYRF